MQVESRMGQFCKNCSKPIASSNQFSISQDDISTSVEHDLNNKANNINYNEARKIWISPWD